MSLQTRVEKLEQQTGAGIPCPVCDAPPREDEKGNYDESVWMVGNSYPVDIDCVHCRRPRHFVFNAIVRRDEAE
jgi:hypothetical protein